MNNRFGAALFKMRHPILMRHIIDDEVSLPATIFLFEPAYLFPIFCKKGQQYIGT